MRHGEILSERRLHRVLKRIEKHFPVVDSYHHSAKEHGVVDQNQVIDFSSAYLEDNKTELADFG